MTFRTALLNVLLSLISFFGSTGTAQTKTRLWLLEKGEVVEYDPFTWTVVNRIKVPVEFTKDPGGLQINHAGQMLFCLDPEVHFGNPDQHFSPDKVWLWDGRTASLLDRRLAAQSSFKNSGGSSVVESTLRPSLSHDGRQLYWFENEFRMLRNADGIEQSVSTTFRAWQTDLSGRGSLQIARQSFPQCKCDTGVCSESCPEARFWFPDEGVDDFFIVTHWIPGQIGVTYQASFLYSKSGKGWSALKLTVRLEDVLSAGHGGAFIIHAHPDGGCCGWDNESDDQTLLTEDGKDVVIFDERNTYANPDYDVSFYTSNAERSPDGLCIAMTVVPTAVPSADIRLSDDGKENVDELARIRRSIADLPGVEVVGVADPSRHLFLIPHATFEGWLTSREMLIAESDVLIAFDVTTGVRRTSHIRVAKESRVFLR